MGPTRRIVAVAGNQWIRVGSRFTISFFVFSSILATLIFLVGRGVRSSDQNAIDSSAANKGLLSPHDSRERNSSTLLKTFNSETSFDASSERKQIVAELRTKASKGKEGSFDVVVFRSNVLDVSVYFTFLTYLYCADDHSNFIDDSARLMQRRVKEQSLKHQKTVDTLGLGKYINWKKDKRNENSNSMVHFMRDQIIMARVYSSIANARKKNELQNELQGWLKKMNRVLGEANVDAELHRSAQNRIEGMGKILSKASKKLPECKLVVRKLRAMVQTADEQVTILKKKSTYLSQLSVKTIPQGIHCLTLRLILEYHLLPIEKRMLPRRENLENPDLYHYAIFSDNVLATSVVINSTIANAKESAKHVFHVVTSKLYFEAMNMWFLLNPPGKATVHIENIDDLKWLNSSYSPILWQLQSTAMRDYHFKAGHATTSSRRGVKYRNPKYFSMLNYLRFYLPQIYPRLNKILVLDDDVVVQKDLTDLWTVNLNGKVTGGVEICGEFNRLNKYLNFSSPRIAREFDPNSCSWAKGMNIFDLEEWKRKDVTGIYHKWQNLNEESLLWKRGTLPPSLVTFCGLTHPLEKSWHLLGLGYNPSIISLDIEDAAVIHYSGNLKPWLESGIKIYQHYWTKYADYNHPYLTNCNMII